MSNKSTAAFLDQVNSGKAQSAKSQIYKFLKQAGDTAYDLNSLRVMLPYPHQTLTPRLSELCDMGLIYETQSGYFRITPDDMIEDVARGREIDRYNKWKALGEKNGWIKGM